MSKRVYFNFEDGPIPGSINMNVVYEGGFDKERPLHRFCVNLLNYLEREAITKGFETVNGEEVLPSTCPEPRLVS